LTTGITDGKVALLTPRAASRAEIYTMSAAHTHKHTQLTTYILTIKI